MGRIVYKNEATAGIETPASGASTMFFDGDVLKSKHSDGSVKTYSGKVFLPDNQYYVSTAGSDVTGTGRQDAPYLTIANAISQVGTPTAELPVLIIVGAGIFEESELAVPAYCSIVGSSINSTTIKPVNANQNLFVCGSEVEISFLSIEGVGSGYAAIKGDPSAEYFETHKVSIIDCDTGILVDASASNQEYYGEYTDVEGTYTHALDVYSESSYTAFVNVENFYTYPESTSSTAEISVVGAGSEIQMLACAIQGTTFNDGVLVDDGAKLVARATIFLDCNQAIHIGDTGTGSSAYIGGVSFQNCTTNLNIESASAIGNFTGYSAYAKTIINRSSSFFITGKDDAILTVSKKGGDFDSIAAAATAIVALSPSMTNRLAISVGPGVYSEPVINLPAFVSVIGENIQTVIVEPDANNHNIFNLNEGSEVSFLTVRNAGSGYAAFSCVNSGDFAQIHKASIFDCDTGVFCHATSARTVVYGEYVDFNGTYSYATRSVSENGFVSKVNVENVYTYPVAVSVAQFQAEGTDAEQTITTGTILGEGSDKAVVAKNGSLTIVNSLDIDGSDTAISSDAAGSGPTIIVSGVSTRNSTTYDILIDHPDTEGSFQGSADNAKISVNTSSDFAMVYADSVQPNVGSVTLQGLYQGDIHARLINLSKLVRDGAMMGVSTGGDISEGSGTREIDVEAGTGFLLDPTDKYVKEITWDADTLTIDPDTEAYIYVNSSAVVSQSSSPVSATEAIFLGRVYMDGSTPCFISNAPIRLKQYGNVIEGMLRDAFAGLYVSGSAVSESGTRKLAVTGGRYYYGTQLFTPSGMTAANFEAYYRSATPGVYTDLITDTVQNTQYDDGDGTLANLTTSYFAKHSLYVVGDGANEKYIVVYSQAEYANIADARAGGIPIPPAHIKNSVVLIASIIVQQGATNIVEIRDERPTLQYKASAVSGVTAHGDLSGLTTGDAGHTQFIMRDGSKAMTGALNMGSQNVTSAGTYNGVTVETHASRHLPTGSDALTTAAPSANITATTTNATGIANSLARSDHGHAVTTGAVSSQTPDQSNAAGSSASLARADHVHNIPTAAPVSIGTANTQGSAATFANSGHVHDHGSQTTGTHHAAVTQSVNGFMSSDDKTKLDYILDYVMKSNQSVATTTPTTITELTTASLPTGTYRWEFNGLFQSTNTNTGIGLRIADVGGTMGVCHGTWQIAQAANGTDNFYQYSQVSPTTNLTSTASLNANSNATAWGSGTFVVSSAGTVGIQLRSETGTSVSLRIGSTLSIRKIG